MINRRLCRSQLTHDAVRLPQRNFHDLIHALPRVAVRIDAQLRRVAGWPDVHDIAIAEINAHAVEDVDARDLVEPERGCEAARQVRLAVLPVRRGLRPERRGWSIRAAAIENEPVPGELHLDHITWRNKFGQDRLTVGD